jgi:hypothetical protein
MACGLRRCPGDACDTVGQVGFLSGERIAWRRWWGPAGEPLQLWDGLLPDPAERSLRYLNKNLVPLDATAGARARILLADPGAGKTVELDMEISRLRAGGTAVTAIDLGEFTSNAEVKDAIASAEHEHSTRTGDLVLALDGFDEPLVDMSNLSDTLVKALRRFDRQRLRVIVASRTSLWHDDLASEFRDWWGHEDVVSLELAPLSESHVAAAAQSDGVDGVDGVDFVAAVRRAGAQPLAARPITLRLLLAGAPGGGLPSRQLDAYRKGVEGLADEPGGRRRRGRKEGPTVRRRVAAAQRLAAASLLSGRPTVVRRASPGQPPEPLALEDAEGDDVTLDDMQAVWDSALLTGKGGSRTWCHHSVAEYLCAEAMAGLPADTVMNLLSAGGDATSLRPQLELAASWTASVNEDVFDRLVETRPGLLLNAELRARPAEQRHRVGRAVVACLARHELVVERDGADALAYPGMAADLRPLLRATQPHWLRREALRLVAVTGLRDLDRQLFAIIRQAAGQTSSEPVLLAGTAAHALARSEDAGTDARLLELLADRSTPPSVRAAIVANAFPKRLDAAGLVGLVSDPADRFSDVLGGACIRAMARAVEAGAVRPSELLGWFASPLPNADRDDTMRWLAASAAHQALTEEPVRSGRWNEAARVVAWLVRGYGELAEWTGAAVDVLGTDRRREVAARVLEGRRDPLLVDALMERRLVQPGDLAWWLDRLAQGLAGEGMDGGLSAGAAATGLVRAASFDDAALAGARDRCAATPLLAGFAASELTPDAVRLGRDRRAALARRRDEQEAERARFDFSASRLDAALADGDYDSVRAEVHKRPPAGERPPGPSMPAAAWTSLTPEQQHAVGRLAFAALPAGPVRRRRYDMTDELAVAIDLTNAGAPDLLDDVAGRLWCDWLPVLLDVGHSTASRTALARSLAADSGRVTATLLDLVDAQAGARGHFPVWVLGLLPAALLEQLSDRAAAAAARPDVPGRALGALLTIAAAAKPGPAADAAMAHVRARPAEQSQKAAPGPSTDGRDMAVTAAASLIGNEAMSDRFDELMTAFRADPPLAVAAVRSAGAWRGPTSWPGASAEQLATLHAWAKVHMPTRDLRPGQVTTADRAEELPNDIVQALVSRADEPALRALETIAGAQQDPFVKNEARRLASALAADAAPPPSPQAVIDVLREPALRLVTSRDQLASVVALELDSIGRDLLKDRRMRRRLWERQRPANRWDGTYVPVEENDLSDELVAELERRLAGRVALFREVQIQPNLSATAGDFPDILALALRTRDGVDVTLPIEVKGSWHRQAVTALNTQLADRYLAGPAGSRGIYVVGHFSGDRWAAGDKRRKASAKRSLDRLRRDLDNQARKAAKNGKAIDVRVLDIPLDLD